MGHRQKGKNKKRLRSWHHLRNQDVKFERAIIKIDEALAKPSCTCIWHILGDDPRCPVHYPPPDRRSR